MTRVELLPDAPPFESSKRYSDPFGAYEGSTHTRAPEGDDGGPGEAKACSQWLAAHVHALA